MITRTSSAPVAREVSPRPIDTPKKAEAGTVVTEIATPTVAAARVSNERIAANPAAWPDRICSSRPGPRSPPPRSPALT